MAEFFELFDFPFPEKDKEHEEIEVKILEIKDAEGKSIKDGANDYDPRKNAVDGKKRTTIKYEIKNNKALAVAVSIVIDKKENKPAKKYYKVQEIESYGFFEEEGDPGIHTCEWDGRVTNDFDRFIIMGDYKVLVEAMCLTCGKVTKDEAKIKVKKPYAHVYGALYPKRFKTARDCRPGAKRVGKWLEKLGDGSGFEIGGSATDDAKTALRDHMVRLSAVWHYEGHAAPGIIDFYDAPYDDNNTSINSNNTVGESYEMDPVNLEAVDSLPDQSLSDVFLVVLNACETALTPDGAETLPDALTSKGVDLVIGWKKEIWWTPSVQWTRAFYRLLEKGRGIRNAAKIARSKVKWGKESLAFRIFSSGAPRNEKLRPARYGRK